jgi:hypothetical protein
MKKKTLKWTLWIAGSTFLLLLPLTVIPGLEYKVEGPWGSYLEKTSKPKKLHTFIIRLPRHWVGYVWTCKEWEYVLEPMGFSSKNEAIHFRIRNTQFSAGQNR